MQIKNLDDIDKQHPMILENLHHIYESLCLTKGIKASKPYRKRKPIDFTNKKIKSCQDCGELFCIKCGRIKIIDGTAFDEQQKRNNKTRKYTFKYTLNKFINKYKGILTPLTQEQINTTNLILKQLEYHLPEKISYNFAIYKILDKVIPKCPQRDWVEIAYFSSPFTRRWEYESEMECLFKKQKYCFLKPSFIWLFTKN